MKCFAAVVVLALGVDLAPAQAVWVVDKFNRPGTDFTELQPAIDAAAQGDIVRVRATTTSVLDGYSISTGNTVINKALTIVGEPGPLRPLVCGEWTIQGVPQRRSLVLSRLTLAHYPVITAPRYFYIAATSCPGAIVLDDIVGNVQGWGGVSGSPFIDCNLVSIQRSNLGGSWTWDRSTLMATDSTFWSAPSSIPWATLTIYRSKATLMGCSVYGPSALNGTNFADTYRSAIYYCSSALTIGGGTHLEAGHDFHYGYPATAAAFEWCSNQSPVTTSLIRLHPFHGTTLGGWATGHQTVFEGGPLSALRATQTPTTLQITQQAEAQSLSVLAMGYLSPQPFTNLVGPAFLDPATASIYLASPTTTGLLTHTFAIPPGLPVGTTVAIQGFELAPSGWMSASNVLFAGIW